MKLRNKKTGKVIEWSNNTDGVFPNTLAELNEEWEDYEEPKPQVVYYIDRDGEIVPYKNVEYPKRVFDTEQNKAIGNYFETKEEAEKAVEELKAWKRLKDKGFKFAGWEEMRYDEEENTAGMNIYGEMPIGEFTTELDILFGGEK